MGGQTEQINHERFHMYLPVAVLDACCKLNMDHSLHTNGICNYKGSDLQEVKLHITRLKDYICFTTTVMNIKIFSSQSCVVTVPEECKLLECFRSKCEFCSGLQPPPNKSCTHQDIEDNSPDLKVLASGKNGGEQQLLSSEANSLNACSSDNKINDEKTGLITMVTDTVTRTVTQSQQGLTQIRSKFNHKPNTRHSGRVTKRKNWRINQKITSSDRIQVEEAQASTSDYEGDTNKVIFNRSCDTDSSLITCGEVINEMLSYDQVKSECGTVKKALTIDDSSQNEIVSTSNTQMSSDIAEGRCSTQDERLSTAGEVMNSENVSETHISQSSDPQKGGATNIRRNSQEIKACKTKSRNTLSNRVSVSGTGSHICEMCSKSFTSNHQLYRHRTMKHASVKSGESTEASSKKLEKNSREQTKDNRENSQSVLCPKCGKCFRTYRAVNSHLASVHGKQWPFKCDSCGRVFKLQKKLESHCCAPRIKAEQHSSGNGNAAGLIEDRGSVSCPLCETTKASYNALYKHLLSKHKQHPRYEEEQAKLRPMMRVQCDRCGLDFSTSTNLRKHMKLRKCSENPSAGMKSGQPCPFCAKISASTTHLAQHMQLMHRQHPKYEEEEKRLRTVLTVQCETCGNWYPDKASWRQHYTNAHAEDRHRCPHCRKPFRLESHMQIHINHRHLGVPYKKSTRRYFRTCKHCPKTFLTKDDLDKHVKLEHRDRKQIHQCDKCSFKYSEAKEYFLHHRKMHSNEGIRCSHCGSTFTSVWFLKKHLKGCTEAVHLSGAQKQFEGQVGMQASQNEDSQTDVENQQVSPEHGNQSAVIHAVHKEKVIQVIPIITPESVHNYSQNVRQPTGTTLQLSGLSDVFNDCVVNQVSHVMEVTIDANSQIVEGTETNSYQPLTELRCEDFQVVEDNVVTSEQVIYLASGTSLDASQLPIGTVIETADVTTYWSGT